MAIKKARHLIFAPSLLLDPDSGILVKKNRIRDKKSRIRTTKGNAKIHFIKCYRCPKKSCFYLSGAVTQGILSHQTSSTFPATSLWLDPTAAAVLTHNCENRACEAAQKTRKKTFKRLRYEYKKSSVPDPRMFLGLLDPHPDPYFIS
jgi:hypothetical protein